MIPTRTLRERMTECATEMLSDVEIENLTFIPALVDQLIEAIGDPCLIKTADSLEPTFTLRAQDILAPKVIEHWLSRNQRLPPEKYNEVVRLADAMRAWPTRKLPD